MSSLPTFSSLRYHTSSTPTINTLSLPAPYSFYLLSSLPLPPLVFSPISLFLQSSILPPSPSYLLSSFPAFLSSSSFPLIFSPFFLPSLLSPSLVSSLLSPYLFSPLPPLPIFSPLSLPSYLLPSHPTSSPLSLSFLSSLLSLSPPIFSLLPSPSSNLFSFLPPPPIFSPLSLLPLSSLSHS